jgi:hypothetical protein
MPSKSLPMAVSVFLLSSFPTSLCVRFKEFHFQISICSQSQLREIDQYSPVFSTFSLAKRFYESIHILSLSCLAKKKSTVKFIVVAYSRFQALCLESKSPTPARDCVTCCPFKQRTKPAEPRRVTSLQFTSLSLLQCFTFLTALGWKISVAWNRP